MYVQMLDMSIKNIKNIENIGYFRYFRKYHDIFQPCFDMLTKYIYTLEEKTKEN